MATDYRKILHFSAAIESTTIAEARRWFHAEDTGRLVITRQDGSTRDYFWNSVSMSSTSSTLGAALIGSAGITGITPNGGSSGAAATLANMLTGFRDSVVLKSPYNSSINTIQPTADYIPLTLKGFAAGTSNLLSLQTSATAVAWFDNKANLTLSRADAGNTVSLRVLNTDNANGASHASIILGAGGASGGDPFVNYSISGGQQWSEGIDRSDAFKYKISEAASLGTSDAFIITPGGAITLNRAVSAGFTMDVSGLITASGGIAVAGGTGSGTYTARGEIVSDATNGLILIGRSGSGTDLILTNSSGQSVMDNPHGGITVRFYGATSIASTLDVTGGNFTVSRSSVGGTVMATISNSNNSNAASHSELFLWTGGGSAGDPFIRFNINGVTDWSAGIDNSVSGDPFKFSNSTALGTSDFFVLDPTNHRAQLTSSANSSLTFQVYNQNSGSLDAAVLSLISSSATGNAFVQMSGLSNSWAAGMNTNNSDAYSISLGGSLGTGDGIVISTSLNVSIPGGNLSVGSNAGTARNIAINSAAGNTRDLQFQTAGTARWVVRADSTSESGSDAGSPFVVRSYNDAGTAIDNPISIVRAASGAITLARPVAVSGGDLSVSRSSSGAQVIATVANTSNTSSSDAKALIQTAGGSSGNPFVHFQVASTYDWSMGVARSAPAGFSAGAFILARSSSLGSNVIFGVEQTGDMKVISNLICNGGAGTYFRPPMGTSDPTSPAEGWMYWNSSGKHLYIYSGTAWLQIV